MNSYLCGFFAVVVKNFALSPKAIFFVVIAPPAPAVTILLPLNENAPTSPKLLCRHTFVLTS